ncbi:HAD hydrolase-like protein [Candidatus Dojkabacteria bacterium]|nr:HAD hydrolase-like protein [Candidatus Dojkabacteria bacterium]
MSISSNGEKQEALLNIRQACKILNVHPDTLRRWERDGKVQSIRIGTRKDRRYKIDEIYSLIELTVDLDSQSKHKFIHDSVSTEQVKKVIRNSKCIILDVGDTLMSPYPSRGHILADIAYSHGYNLSPDEIEVNYQKLYDDWEKEKLFSTFTIYSDSKVREDLYAKLNADALIKSGFPEQEKVKAVKIGRENYRDVTSNPQRWKTFNGVLEFLEKAKKEGKTIVILDNWNEYLDSFIKKSDIGGYVDFIVCGGVMQIRKPDPKIFNIALEKANAKATDAVYIGNRYIDDVLGPQKAGIVPLLFDMNRQHLGQKYLRFYRYSDLIA